jgi:erythronate-4-phosphate dehydrogenase
MAFKVTSNASVTRPTIIVDDNIPFIKGRIEPFADVVYADQFGFTPELVKEADALVIRTRTLCNKELLDGSKVKLIATATIGMDQIDLDYCANHGIKVRNSPGCNAPGVAQYVWSSLLRNGFNPATDTLGVVGCGNVGSIVADWGIRLGAKVIVNDPPKEESGDISRQWTGLEETLRRADAVTLHTPLIRDGKHPTFHLIGEQELAIMKNGAILVNAARGPVVDTVAVKKEVNESRIRAIIDTWEGEPQLDCELLDMVEIGTFHIAGYSYEGKQRATRMVLEALNEHFKFDISTDDLAPAYTEPEGLCAEMITSSYNPYADMAPLIAEPKAFDTLRANYNYRHEAGINK